MSSIPSNPNTSTTTVVNKVYKDDDHDDDTNDDHKSELAEDMTVNNAITTTSTTILSRQRSKVQVVGDTNTSSSITNNAYNYYHQNHILMNHNDIMLPLEPATITTTTIPTPSRSITSGDETPPRRSTTTDDDNVIGMRRMTGAIAARHRFRSVNNTNSETMSMSSSIFSVASGMVALVEPPVPEDLEGLIVQTIPQLMEAPEDGEDDPSFIRVAVGSSSSSGGGGIVFERGKDDDNFQDEQGDDNNDMSNPTLTSPYPNNHNYQDLTTMTTSSQSPITLQQLQDLMVDLKHYWHTTIHDLQEQNTHDFEKVKSILQQESIKRTDLEQRFFSQLLLQSETMVAMELKLLRLEAKVERREAALRKQQHHHRRVRAPPPPPTVSILEEEETSTTPAMLLRGSAATTNATTTTTTMMMNPDIASNHTQSAVGMTPTRTVGPANIMAVIASGGASLASGVTAGSFLVDGEEEEEEDSTTLEKNNYSEDDDDDDDVDGDVEDDDDDEEEEGDTQDANHDESYSTPTQGSRRLRPIQIAGGTLDSIMLNPMVGETAMLSPSIRATRGETDGNSSLATSVTNSTIASTVVTATTRGDSVGVNHNYTTTIRSHRFLNDLEEPTTTTTTTTTTTVDDDMDLPPSQPQHETVLLRSDVERGDLTFVASLSNVDERGYEQHPRSRSQSPLTVQSSTIASEAPSLATNASVGTSLLSTAAVASSRAFGTRRATAAAAVATTAATSTVSTSTLMENRPIANRVVTFTTDILNQADHPLFGQVDGSGGGGEEEGGGGGGGGGDSIITMPDELDNLSDVADVFAASARSWREEYEARLDALQKRWATE